jgi:OPA family glycerol-3-phosphate transporter-like MFS transporter
MDFGGRKRAGTATGFIDGAVYLGTFVQSVSLGYLTTRDWAYWPFFMIPFAVIGFLLCTRIWNAKPKSKAVPAVVPAPTLAPAEPKPSRTGT